MLRRTARAANAKSCLLSRGSCRFASTTPQSVETLSPAVSFLLHSKRVDAKTIPRIPRTGPKNRLLKGDVLKFLANPSIIEGGEAAVAEAHEDGSDSLVPQAYYGREIVANELVGFVKSLNETRHLALTVNDFLVHATALALQAVPEGKFVNARWDETKHQKEIIPEIQLSVTRVSPIGISSNLIQKPLDVGALKLHKTFKDQGETARNAKGAFSIWDHVFSPAGDITPYLQPYQTGILTIGPVRTIRAGDGPSAPDLLDILTGSAVSTRPAPPSPTPITARVVENKNVSPSSTRFDEIDLLSRPSPSSAFTGLETTDCTAKYVIKLDLTVDGRCVSPSVAAKFLKELEGALHKKEVLQSLL